ncbi:MAG: MFS transporter [Actinomycetota bacterium]|nr:MFS transporter [Actinomycetota bacterium]
MLVLLRRRPELRRLFLAHAVSRAGDAFNSVALVLLVFQLTGSGRDVATTVAFEVAPVLLLGPVAGLLADRLPRRRVMVAADLLRAGLAVTLALATGSVALAYGVAFGLSVGSLAFNPAASSLLPEVVDAEEVVDANTALWTVAVTAQIVLAPLAGVLIATAGVGVAFGLNAVSYLVSALLLLGLHAGRTPADMTVRGWKGVAAGITAVRTHPLLARLAVVQILASLSAGATSGLLVVLAADWLGVGPSGFGVLLGAIGVGAALGPLVLRSRIRAGDRRWLFGPYALRGGVDLALASVGNPIVAAGALAAYGVGTSTGMIAYQSTLQMQVPTELRGRTFALYDVLWNAARLVSLGAGGLLADAVGIRAVYVVAGLLLLAAAAVGWASPRPNSPLVTARLGD